MSNLLFAFLSCCLCKVIWYLCCSGGMIGCAGACRCSRFLQFGSFSMAKTAIASNRAVPGKYVALEYKYAIQFFCQAFQVMWRKKSHNPWLHFSSPLLSLYIFFFFYPWTALLCYDCISYEGSVSDTGSGPHGRKDCTSKSLTGTIRDGAGECLLSFLFVLIFDFDAWILWVALFYGLFGFISHLKFRSLDKMSRKLHVVQVLHGWILTLTFSISNPEEW